jgi:hypothetical protein
MYHLCDALDINIYMEESQWHIIDNIGSGAAFNILIFSFLNVTRVQIQKINFIFFLVIIILQFADPWNIINTVVPIVLAFLYTLYVNYIKYPRNESIFYNKNKTLRRGVYVFPFALFFFILGLDEHTDYLRLSHSLWHILICYSAYYLTLYNFHEHFESYSEVFWKKELLINYLNI